jgi:hypothetical protein
VVTSDEHAALITAGIVPDQPIALWDGRLVWGEHDVIFAPAQVAAAARMGIVLRSCVDVVLEHDELRGEVAARLAEEVGGAA